MQRTSGDMALVWLEEIRRTPELFPSLRSVIDERAGTANSSK